MNGKPTSVRAMLPLALLYVFVVGIGCTKNGDEYDELAPLRQLQSYGAIVLPTNAVVQNAYQSADMFDAKSYYRIIMDNSETNTFYSSVYTNKLMTNEEYVLDLGAVAKLVPWWKPQDEALGYAFKAGDHTFVWLYVEKSLIGHVLYVAIIPL